MCKDIIGIDKLKHLGACFAISLYSTEAAICAALAKEYGDKENKYNHWCWWDILADTVGIIAGTAVRVLITKRWNWL